MKFSDQISLSAKNLSRRIGRTALTVVGVVVGTCAVIVMISLGIAQNQANEEMLSNWGDLTQIEVYGGGYNAATGAQIELNDELLAKIDALPNVVVSTPFYNSYYISGYISAGNSERYQCSAGNITALFPEAMEPMGFALTDGDWLQKGQSYGKDKLPVLICAGSAYNFEDTRKSHNSSKRYRYYGQTDANGNQVAPFFDINKADMTLTITDGNTDNPKTKSWDLVVVGTIAEDFSKGWWTQSGMVMRIEDIKMVETAYASLTNTKSTQPKTYNSLTVKVDEVANVDAVNTVLTDEMGLNTYSMTQQRDEMQKQVARSQLMLGGLAAVSLLVAALNIANTMTMAIYERTREIGVMKVLGCEIGNIRTMFLIESGFIGFIGGVAGSIISLVAGFVLNNLSSIMAFFGQSVDLSGLMGNSYYYMGDSSSKISVIPPWLVLAALVFATVIGLVSGIAPANKAVKISALEAIRHD